MNDFQPQKGNRFTLSLAERELLETKVLPTARRWLSISGLASIGTQTLDYWDEPHSKSMEAAE